MSSGVTIKTPQEIEIIRQGGEILARILRQVAGRAKAGATTRQLDELAEKLIIKSGGRPAFKNFSEKDSRPFPTTLCTSINDEVVHAPAVPGRVLKDGDLLKIDIGMCWPVYNAPHLPLILRGGVASTPPLKLRGGEGGVMSSGLYTDMAITVAVGKISREAQKLMDVTREALEIGIREVKSGGRVSDIGRAVQKYVEDQGFSVVRDLVGHGVGYKVHESPSIPNFWRSGMADCVLKEGMVICIEPMVIAGGWHIRVKDDDWSIASADGTLAAHFEHTMAVIGSGAKVLTR